ncbi:MAG: DUF1634 domain-containing protein [Gammaproteobacteria bacterium]
MISNQRLEKEMGAILLVGMLLALTLVIIGGGWYLIENGSATLQTELLLTNYDQTSITQILDQALSLSPLSLIELGLLILVATQIIRVGLLVWFYFRLHDYWFVSFSLFVFFVLVYSLFSGNIK